LKRSRLLKRLPWRRLHLLKPLQSQLLKRPLNQLLKL
jgi:hypothetical protein